MTAPKILWGVFGFGCIIGALWLLANGIWQAVIPLALLATFFGGMAAKGIAKAL